jgi:hypothetical protein
MEYRKPEMLLVSSAMDAIQSGISKHSPNLDSTEPNFPSPGPAYESDEQ